MKKTTIFSLILGAFAIFIVIILVAGDTTPLVQQQTRNAIFSLSFDDYEGNEVKMSDFAGKPLVLNTWAAWCPFCVEELKDFAEAQRELGDDVVIMAINRQEPLATAKKFSDELGVTGDMVFVLDPNDSFYRAIGGFSMPETLFINAAGEIVHHKRGPMRVEEIRKKIQDIL